MKKNKGAQEKVVALTQIFILLTSLVAVSYFIGNEFRFVSADTGTATPTLCNADGVCNLGENMVTCPSDCSCGDGVCNLARFETYVNCPEDCREGDSRVNTPPVPSLPPAPSQQPPADVPETPKPNGWDKIWDVAGKIIETGVAATVFGAIFGGIVGWASGNWDAALNVGLWAAGAYAATTALLLLIGGETLKDATLFGGALPVLGAVTWPALAIGAVVGLIALFAYKEERTIVVQYSCSKWEAPSGGEGQCERCNNNANIPCTKYKCESLGSGCVLLNVGKSNERCAFIDRNDPAAPAISTNNFFLQDNFSYVPASATMPSNSDSSVGVTIKYTGNGADVNGCIPYYKTLKYGISLDKLGRCKADTVRTDNYSSMRYSLSDDTADYNHSITTYFMNSTVEYSMNSIILRSGGEYETHIRCNSTSGAPNLATFFFKYCVQDQPDTSAPLIKFKNPETGSPIRKGETSKNITIYVDKPSECKWDRTAFSDITQMANNMTCQSTPTSIDGVNLVYECKTTLTGLLDEQENKYYFLCKSYPDKLESERYANVEAIGYSLIGTKDLVIQELTPEQDSLIRGSTQFVNVSVDVTTFGGYDNGKALCSLKNANDATDSYQLFGTTNSNIHKQMLWLESGSYSYNVNCCDLGLNCDEETLNFKVESDFLAPLVIRINNELRGTNQLKLTTNEKAECAYSITDCTYNFAEGNKFTSEDQINHFAEWDTDNTFYVKCRDEFTNQPATDQCSVVVRPFNSH